MFSALPLILLQKSKIETTPKIRESRFFRRLRLDASVGASGPHAFAVRFSTFRQARRSRPPHPAPRP
jgi:hypothetical protein